MQRQFTLFLRYIAALFLILALNPPLLAQDVEGAITALSGSAWILRVEGDVRTRTLKIKEFKGSGELPQKLEAQYGWSDIGLSSVPAELALSDGTVTFRLTSLANSSLVAIFREHDLFVGSFTLAGGKARSARLERIPLDAARLPEVTSTEVSIPGNGVTLSGILRRPGGLGPNLPAVVVLHGWGERWVNGAAQVSRPAGQLATAGYITLAVSMRGWPKSGGYDDCGLEQPADIAKVLDWLAQQPDVDPTRIAVVGYSQGGQVALATAALSRRPRAVVAYYPVTDIERWGRTTSHDGIRNDYVPRTCSFGKARSPILSAASIEAPVLFLHGDQDTRVPTEQSFLMHEALKSAGHASQLRIVKGAAHGFTQAQSIETLPIVLDFLARQMHVIR